MAARRYDSRVNTYSPDGRLFQVEYAMRAISHAGAAIGVLSRGEGIVLTVRGFGCCGVLLWGGAPALLCGSTAAPPAAPAPLTRPTQSERKVVSKLLDNVETSEKMFKVDGAWGRGRAGSGRRLTPERAGDAMARGPNATQST